jgi:glycosyltransferase involved in cell wall biosynthesis
MKIVHIFSGIDHHGGLPVEVRNLIISQIKIGNEIYVVSERRKYSNNYSLNGISKLFLLKDGILNKYKELIKILNEVRPNYLHLYGGWDLFNVICWFAIKKAKLPYIITIHGNLNPFIYKRRF